MIGQEVHGSTMVYACSSTGVEALVVLQALRWAKAAGLRSMQNLTDNLLVVHALSCLDNVDVSICNVILDILGIMNLFDYVNVVKATRGEVKNAHDLAWRLLCNLSLV